MDRIILHYRASSGTFLSDSYNDTDGFIQLFKLFRYMYISCGYYFRTSRYMGINKCEKRDS